MKNRPFSDVRRRLMLGSLGALASAAFPAAGSDAAVYPSRPITFICPWPVGGNSDVTMRSLVALAGRELGQEVVVENRAGGSGMVGTRAIVNAKPDGYTIGMLPLSVTRFAQLGTLSFDPLQDLSLICRASGQTFGILVRGDSRYRTLQELIAHARAKPNEITYSHSGLGAATHVGMELFLAEAKLNMVDVPQKGGAPALAALLNGKVDVLVASTPTLHVEAGRLRLLATWSEQASVRFPDVPTLKELGFNIAMTEPNGIAAPKGLDPRIALRLRDAFRKAILSKQYKRDCDALDVPVMYLDADEYRRYLEDHYAAEAKLIERLRLKELLADADRNG